MVDLQAFYPCLAFWSPTLNNTDIMRMHYKLLSLQTIRLEFKLNPTVTQMTQGNAMDAGW